MSVGTHVEVTAHNSESENNNNKKKTETMAAVSTSVEHTFRRMRVEGGRVAGGLQGSGKRDQKRGDGG
jgi:hypothetical protein